MIKIIDNKKIDLTNEEWQTYLDLCRDYTRTNFDGKDMFRSLFETNEDGIIIAMNPPSTQYTSMEIYLYMSSIMIHQHLRLMHTQVDQLCTEIRDKFKDK